MSYVDLEAKKEDNFPKVLLPRESTVATVMDVTSWQGTKKAKDKDGKEIEKPSEKLIISVKLADDKLISCFQNAKCAKGSKPSFDTLSYTNATNLGLLEKIKEEQSKLNTLEDVVTFWKKELVGKKIKFVPETIIPEIGPRYSILKIIDGWA
jgi:hypothetical protein